MAKVYLESTDTAFTISNNNTTVFGATGDQVVTVASGVTGVTYDQNTERVVFAGASSAYTYLQSGNQILVYSGGVLVATIPVQGDTNGTQLTFTNGTANAVLTTGVMALGGTTVSSTAAATVTPATIDTTVVSSGTGSTGTGTSTVFTTSIDVLTGTSGDDTFIGDTAKSTAADQVNGGAGTDTLKIYRDGTTDFSALPTISSIEAIYLNSAGNAGDTIEVNVSSNSEITSLTIDNQVTEDSINYTIASTQSISLKSITEGTAGENIDIVTGSSVTSVSATVNTVGTSTTDVDVDIVGTGVTTLNLTSTGTASYFSLQNTGAALTTLNVAGDIASTINLDDDSNAGALTSAVTAITITNTAGVTVTTDDDAGKNITFTGSTGNDGVYYGSHFDSLDSAVGGTGTDTIGIADGSDLVEASGAKATGFETLDIVGSASITAYDLDYLSGITTVALSGALAANTTVKDMSTSTSVVIKDLSAANTLTLQQKDAGAGSPSDTLTVTFDKSSAIAANAASNVIIDDIETVTVASTSSGTSITHVVDQLQIDEATQLTINASTAALTITELTSAAMVLLDASSSAKLVNVTVGAIAFTAATGVAFKGGAGKDIFDLKAATDFASSTTAGDIQLTGGAAGDTFKIDTTVDDEIFTFNFAAGDSKSLAGATAGYDASVTDTIQDFIAAASYASTAGNKFVLNSEVSATAVTFSTSAATLGTTTVSNAYDFYVYDTTAGGIAYVYQDTDGDKLLEAGEFAVKLVGATSAFTTGEFAISTGDLVYTSIV